MKKWLILQLNEKPAMTDWQKDDFKVYCQKNPKARFYLEPIESTRTMPQNRLYWMYLGIIERETGEEAWQLHEYFKRTHLPPKFIKVRGKEIKIPQTTTNLKKLEFGEYMDKICAETNVPIPDTEAWNYGEDESKNI